MAFALLASRNLSVQLRQGRKARIVMLDYYPLQRMTGTRRDHDRTVMTICQECSVGCGLSAYVNEGRLVDVQGDERHPVSNGRLCARGTSFIRDLDSPDRITRLADRKSLQDDFEELDNWDQALDLLADRLKKIRDQHGPRGLFIDCDPAAGLDFYYAAARFAALWGTPHVYSPFDGPNNSASVPSAPDSRAFDWIHSRCLFIVGADPASTHPVAFRWAMEAQKNGAKIVVADTRFTRTMSKADLALRILPDAGNRLGMALMKVMLDEGLCGPNSIPDGLDIPESWWNAFDEISLETAAKSTGLGLPKLKEAALLLAKIGPTQLITGKSLANLPAYGIWRTMSLVKGWPSRKGGGWYPLDSGQPRLNPLADLHPENTEKTVEPPQPDSQAASSFDSVKAIICSGGLDNCCSHWAAPGEAPALIAHFGLISNETSTASHMLFPAQSWAERDGLFFSNDRAIQWGAKIAESPDSARSGLDFWIGLAKRFGWADHFPWRSDDNGADSEAFFDWLLSQSPVTKGCTVQILKKASVDGTLTCWPLEQDPNRQGADAPLRGSFEDILPSPANMPLQPAYEENELYPFYLEVPDAISRRAISAENGMLNNGNWLQISPETARALGIESGEEVAVHDSDTFVEVRAWITRMVPRGLVYLPSGSHSKRVLVRKKRQSSEEALSILRKLLS